MDCQSYIYIFVQVHAVVGVLSDDTDPMVTVMKLEKAPQETYADIGGLDTQIQEIKVQLYVLPGRKSFVVVKIVKMVETKHLLVEFLYQEF